MTEPANDIKGLESAEFYQKELDMLLSKDLPSYQIPELEALHLSSLNELENENIENLIPKIILKYIDSSSETLTSLSNSIVRHLANISEKFLVNSKDIAGYIHKLATRKNYGKKCKEKYEDNSKISLWCWELLDHTQPSFIQKERLLIGGIVKCLDRLITQISKPDSKSLSDCFSNYNKQVFLYDKFKNEQVERKRKKDMEEELKERKNREKADKKRSEEEAKKAERIRNGEKKEEERKRKEEERKKVEEEKRRKAQEEKERKDEDRKRREEEEKKKKKDESDKNDKRIDMYFQKVDKNFIREEREQITEVSMNNNSLDFTHLWSSCKVTITRQSSFIYFTDSHLKPYYNGPLSSKLNTNMLTRLSHIDYEINSEEEFEELNGENIELEKDQDEEESVYDSDIEELQKFIVKDGYLSADEKVEDEEVPVLTVNLYQELQPMQVFALGSEELQKFKAFCLQGENLPIEMPKKPPKIVKEVKPPKMQIDDKIEQDIIEIASGKVSKDEIVKAVLEKYAVSKSSIRSVIKSRLVKQTDGKIKAYILKPEAVSNN